MKEIWQYADRARTQLGTAGEPVISYTGLWLLLALVAPAAEGRAITEALGLPPEEARETAEKLIAEAHPTVAAALGAWLADWVEPTAPLPVAVEPLPDQETLNAWAAENTRGLIQSMPVTIGADTMLLLATALVTTPEWAEPLTIEDGRLVLRMSLQAIVETSVGPVAVARPGSRDGVDVFSVIAAPEVPADDVWVAVAEVIEQYDAGELTHMTHPEDLSDGHAWTVKRERRDYVAYDAPEPNSVVFTTRLPAWSADASHELESAPGVASVAAGIAARLPEQDGGIEFSCTQNATAAYDQNGFKAAAVTAMAWMAGSAMPEYVERKIRHVQVSFDRPHAVIAITRGGAWDGIPLFEAWVTPEMFTAADPDWADGMPIAVPTT
ncbi:hypothetical protein ACFU7D_10735 [Nocardioides sp. NPDC057577]|uniref:hypothetical protein n=1 Tax=Nocardioides sp. NPDC057577 TaxID=3346171 RepID=UPI00366C5B6A